ncbi:glycosyltransferase [Aquabacterium sp. CECT 9606]|uniref:glycosyltransferase n=1 Tax=Aquabacterium sp. CECT 9606 TaxID=2845822 RepID=UPI001E456B05|nr:glycosyltransferase [Aquabacterium sp. CECT 9606]CAH0348134.1 D-inositol-3-phosphate glycosyltransferase [Aquabacterium sp. CECT 9606]
MKALLARLTDARFWRFACVGIVFVALNLVTLKILVDYWSIPYLQSCVIAFVLLNFFSYRINKVFAFRLEADFQGRELFRYYFVMAFSLLINLTSMWILVDIFKLNYLWASLAVSAVLAVMNFSGHANLTFTHSTTARRPVRSVLMVSAFFPAHGGGIEVVAGKLVDGLSQSGLTIQWMAGGYPAEFPGDFAEGVEVDQAASIDFLEKRLGMPLPIWSAGSVWRLWKRMRRADLVHVHDFLYMPSLMAMVFAAMQGKPLVLTQHIGAINFKSPLASFLIGGLNKTIGKMALIYADQVVFVGRPVLEYFKTFVKFRRPPCLVSNGVNHHIYFNIEREPILVDRKIKILYVGRFVEKKGIDLIKYCITVPRTEWIFIGWGPLSPLAWPGGLPAHVTVLENLRSDLLVPYFQQADLLVLPSTGEGFPLVIQEAMACGTPVLVSAEVAAAFPTTDPTCVFQVELRHQTCPEVALRFAVEALVGNPQRLVQGRSSAKNLSLQWSWDRCVAEYIELYAAVS